MILPTAACPHAHTRTPGSDTAGRGSARTWLRTACNPLPTRLQPPGPVWWAMARPTARGHGTWQCNVPEACSGVRVCMYVRVHACMYVRPYARTHVLLRKQGHLATSCAYGLQTLNHTRTCASSCSCRACARDSTTAVRCAALPKSMSTALYDSPSSHSPAPPSSPLPEPPLRTKLPCC